MSPELLSSAHQSFEMFAFLSIELTVLFLAVSYLVGVLQEHIPPEKIKHLLQTQNGQGYLIAAFLGAITPFCSCSTIPFLKGLLKANAGFGSVMVFLFTSPLLNPIVIALLVTTFGMGVAAYYFCTALIVSLAAGYTLEKLGFERFVKPDVYNVSTGSCTKTNVTTPSQQNRWLRIWTHTWRDFHRAIPYLLLSITVGSIIYGFVPTELISHYASKDNVFAIPSAALIGIPLYIRAGAIIPLSAALAAKGMGMGAVMALIIGSAGASLTEVILLKSLFKNRLVVAFLFVVLSMAMLSGFVLDILG